MITIWGLRNTASGSAEITVHAQSVHFFLTTLRWKLAADTQHKCISGIPYFVLVSSTTLQVFGNPSKRIEGNAGER
jgi:hypothetical protein